MGNTHVHVQSLAISFRPADRRGHHDQLVLCHKVTDASLFALRIVTGMCLEIELEGGDEREEEGEKECQSEACHSSGQGGLLRLYCRGRYLTCTSATLRFEIPQL